MILAIQNEITLFVYGDGESKTDSKWDNSTLEECHRTNGKLERGTILRFRSFYQDCLVFETLNKEPMHTAEFSLKDLKSLQKNKHILIC